MMTESSRFYFDATVDLNAAAPTLARVAPEELKHFTPVLFEMFNRHLWQVWDRLSEAKPTGCVWKCDSRRTATTRTFRFTIDRVMNEKQRENLRPWKPGQSGNPSGRPKTAPIREAFVRRAESKLPDHVRAAIEKSGFTLPRRATFADALVAVIFAGGLKGNAACARIIHDIIEGQRVVVSEAGMSRMLRERIIEKFDEISKDPRGTDSKKLDDATYRVRVGDYRIVYHVNDAEDTVLVTRIRHRREVYRRR